MWRPSKVVSGGQTGADQGGIIAAKLLGIPTGGWAPRGFKTEDGPAYWLGLEYGLKEHYSESYASRTAYNIQDSSATFIFGYRSPGSQLTRKTCGQRRKPHLWLMPEWDTEAELAEKLGAWLMEKRPVCLNIAGNRESVYPGINRRMQNILTILWGK